MHTWTFRAVSKKLRGKIVNISDQIRKICRASKAAATVLGKASPALKNRFLELAAFGLEKAKSSLVSINEAELQLARDEGMDEWRLDRMRLTGSMVEALVKACYEVVEFPDPVGATETQWQRPNGLLVGKMRVPIGVIAMIYEARPAVTIEAAILALKAGNAIILRGGKEVRQTNAALVAVLEDALRVAGLPESCVAQAPQGGHEVVETLCHQGEYIDLMIPRGGEGLIRAVAKAAEMPVLMHYKGVCHAFIDAGADPGQAVKIVENSKTQRPAVCNALECVLVHRDIAGKFLPLLARQLAPHEVEFRADEAALPLLGPAAVPVRPDDLGREFMSQILVVLVVPDMDAAISHIDQYGSRHTDIICTENYGNAMRFLREVDASMVAVNASTRFNDGGQLGLGAEIGISTTKLHAYGPMGIKELTTTKYVVLGNGQVRD